MTMTIKYLPLLPSFGIHEDLEEPLNDEEEVQACPYGHRYTKIAVVRININFCKSENVKLVLVFDYVFVFYLNAEGIRWKTAEPASEPTASPIKQVNKLE